MFIRNILVVDTIEMEDLITVFKCKIASLLLKSLAKLKIEVTFIDISIIETQMNRFLFTIDTDFDSRKGRIAMNK